MAGQPTRTGIDAADRLRQPHVYKGADLECDIVMKGGITSGVAYPLAACELATRYRLKNVGGTSAGAIAASAAAAAEFGRGASLEPEPPAGSGFVGLAALPGWIGADGNLLKLFRPSRATSPIFRLLLAAIRVRTGPFKGLRRAFATLGRLIWAGIRSRFVLLELVALLPGIAILAETGGNAETRLVGLGLLIVTAVFVVGALGVRRPEGAPVAPCAPPRAGVRSAKEEDGGRMVTARLLVAAAGATGVVLNLWTATPSLAWTCAAGWLTLLVGLVGGSAGAVLLSAGRVLPDNLFGLVSGSGDDRGEALSDWLTRLINELAGRRPDDPPLTFGDLWDGPGPAAGSPSDDEPFVNLEMLTTCLTQGRPYRLPNDLNRNWFFSRVEFERLFPASIIKHLVEYEHRELAGDDQQEWLDLAAQASRQELLPLPDPDGLPVAVAARMSLSFPILLSAVPLHTLDYSCPSPEGEGLLEPCWFSDGGITSNFPVTFFDSILPRRPTFGINLRPFHPRYPQSADEGENVWMPRRNNSGILEWWNRPGATSGVGAVTGFIAAILDTMQNWVDNRQLQVPGFRDRIVHISHSEKEGGMNLDMPPCVLADLSERGRCAGARLVEFYTQPPNENRTVSWENHRWIRMRSALGLIQDGLVGASRAYPHVYSSDLNLARGSAPSYQWENLGQRALALALMQGRPDDAQATDPVLLGEMGLTQLGLKLEEITTRMPTHSLTEAIPSPAPRLIIAPGYEGRPAS